MSKHDWYRKTNWTNEDKSDFFKRLNKSKGIFYKAQYLRIQAYYLTENNPNEALELIGILINEYPEESQLSEAYSIQARCYKILKDKENVVKAYNKSFETRRAFPNFKTNNYLEFGVWVVTEKIYKYYDDALKLIDEFDEPHQIFPQPLYYKHGIISLINYYKGNFDISKTEAEKALHYASQSNSGIKNILLHAGKWGWI